LTDGTLGKPAPSTQKAIWDWRSPRDSEGRAVPVWPRLLRIVVLACAFGGFAWWRGHRTAAAVLAAFALANVVLAVLAPRAFHWHAGLWEKLGRAGAFVMGAVALTLAYFLLFTPAALLLRLLGREPLKLRFPGPQGTCWSDVAERSRSEADYRKQF